MLQCRIELERTRLLVLEAADQLDRHGNKKARGILAMAKVHDFFCILYPKIYTTCYLVCLRFYSLLISLFYCTFSVHEKVASPAMALKVLDTAMQVHGAAGVSGDTVLAHLWAASRTLRIADGPDEVHLETIAKLELRRAKL